MINTEIQISITKIISWEINQINVCCSVDTTKGHDVPFIIGCCHAERAQNTAGSYTWLSIRQIIPFMKVKLFYTSDGYWLSYAPVLAVPTVMVGKLLEWNQFPDRNLLKTLENCQNIHLRCPHLKHLPHSISTNSLVYWDCEIVVLLAIFLLTKQW